MIVGIGSVTVCPRLPSLVEYVEQPLTAGLKDRAACVRRVAVLGWAKLHNLQPKSEIGRMCGLYIVTPSADVLAADP